MSSLNGYYSPLVGFFSYSRDDDATFRGALSALREAIEGELSAQLGRSSRNFQIWQDRADIPYGDEWQKQIKLGIGKSAFFIPIITPRVVNSDNCELEFTSFLAREKELGRDDLIFPILYISVPELEDDAGPSNDPVVAIVRARQWFDFREQRYRDPRSGAVAEQISRFCSQIAAKLRKQWESPEERQQREKTDADRIAAQEQTRATAERDAQIQAEEGERRRKADAERRAAEEESAKQAARETQAREAEKRRIEDAAAAQRAAQETAFTSAKLENKAAAISQFISAYPDSHLKAEAQTLAGALLAREEAHGRAMAGDDASVLRAFCKTYRNGADVDAVRARLRAIASPGYWPPSRPALAAAAAIIAVLFAGVLGWALHNPSPTASIADVKPGPTAAPIKTVTITAAPPQTSPPTPVKTVTVPAGVPQTVLSIPAAVPPTPSVKLADATPSAGVIPPACVPNAAQRTDFIGGQSQPATLKLALSPAQIANIAVRSIAISPDGTTLATAGDDHVVRIWSAADLKWIREIRGHTAEVYGVAYSADGNLLASASFDGTVRVWNAHTFAPVSTFTASSNGAPVKQYGVAFEPRSNPQYVDSVGADGTVWIWDLRSNQRAGNPKSTSATGNADPTVGSLSFAPNSLDGLYATSNFDGTVKLFSPGRADVIAAFSPGKALRVAYSPDGKFVAAAGVDDAANQTVRIWNAADRTLFKSFDGQQHSAVSLAWSLDGKRLASGGGYKDMTIRLRDVQSGKQLQKLSGHTADIEAVAFHPNQKWIVSAGEDAMVKIWDIATGKELLSVVGFSDGEYLAYAPSGCYTGSANAPNYVKFVYKDSQGLHDAGNGKSTFFVPGDSTALLLPQ